jgi:hypothetical protein
MIERRQRKTKATGTVWENRAERMSPHETRKRNLAENQPQQRLEEKSRANLVERNREQQNSMAKIQDLTRLVIPRNQEQPV